MTKPRNRRGELLRRLKVDSRALAASPQITPLLRRSGIHPDRLAEVLRCDDQAESLTYVQRWDELTPANQEMAGVEAVALSVGMTPRRLWELFQGASLMQAKQSVAVMLADSLPEIMQRTITSAKSGRTVLDREGNAVQVDDLDAQEIIYKAARIMPTPKGSTTVINMPGHNADEDDDNTTSGGDLESADDFMLRASKAMGQKALPPAIVAEVVED